MKVTPFNQPPPALGNQYDDDRPLRSLLARLFPKDALAAIEPELRELGALAGGELYRLQLEDRLNEPTLTHWDAWGNRIDRIEVGQIRGEGMRGPAVVGDSPDEIVQPVLTARDDRDDGAASGELLGRRFADP